MIVGKLWGMWVTKKTGVRRRRPRTAEAAAAGVLEREETFEKLLTKVDFYKGLMV